MRDTGNRGITEFGDCRNSGKFTEEGEHALAYSARFSHSTGWLESPLVIGEGGGCLRKGHRAAGTCDDHIGLTLYKSPQRRGAWREVHQIDHPRLEVRSSFGKEPARRAARRLAISKSKKKSGHTALRGGDMSGSEPLGRLGKRGARKSNVVS